MKSAQPFGGQARRRLRLLDAPGQARGAFGAFGLAACQVGHLLLESAQVPLAARHVVAQLGQGLLRLGQGPFLLHGPQAHGLQVRLPGGDTRPQDLQLVAQRDLLVGQRP